MLLQSSFFPADTPLVSTPLLILLCFIFGACIGSFLNVVIHRLPRGESIVFPNSKCPGCGASIKFYDNIPILGYLMLGGRCRACRTGISIRYPAVEALTGALFALVAWHAESLLALPFDLLFVAGIIALIFIDAEHMILPNKITYPGAVLAFIARLIAPNLYGVNFLTEGALQNQPAWLVSLVGAIFGAVLGAGSLWLIGWAWKQLRGVEAMGLGDVKMMLMVGAYLGPSLTMLTIFVGFITGSIAGVALLARTGQRDMNMQIPFGIFLGLGSIVSLLFGQEIINWYLGQFG